MRSPTTASSAGVPPAAGVRLDYFDLPRPLRAVLDEQLGSPVFSATTAVGGFSPGVAARLVCADGRRVFVKAVSPAQNPDSPTLHRREAWVTAALPVGAPAPRLRFDYDDGDWVVLAFDVIDGAPPTMPWSLDDARTALAAVADMGRALAPSPLRDAPTVLEQIGGDLLAWTRLGAHPPADLDPWERTHLDRLVTTAQRFASHDGPMRGPALLHLDLRADNILIGPDRRVTIVDWPWACRGPAWTDPVALGLDLLVYGGHDPEPLLAEQGLLDGVDPDAVTGFLLCLAGMWAEAYRQPAPPGLPTLRAFQHAFHDAAIAWARRRAGWH